MGFHLHGTHADLFVEARRRHRVPGLKEDVPGPHRRAKITLIRHNPTVSLAGFSPETSPKPKPPAETCRSCHARPSRRSAPRSVHLNRVPERALDPPLRAAPNSGRVTLRRST
jgi:hypothetical protein